MFEIASADRRSRWRRSSAGCGCSGSIAKVKTARTTRIDRGADRPADLQARVAVDLRGDGALARAELEQRVDQRALDADEDDDRRRRG
jgi:hypothetical protein